MAKLFDLIFTDTASCDVVLVVSPDNGGEHMQEEQELRLWCHSVILSQQQYFCKMLQLELREARTREVYLREARDEFVELIRFIYTGHIDIHQENVVGLLALADKYCVGEVVDLCLKHVKDHFDADMFFNFYDFTTLCSVYRDKLNDQIVSALQQRRHFCSIIEDPRWCELPFETVELILSNDSLPVTSEAEVLTLISLWIRPHIRCSEACQGGTPSGFDDAEEVAVNSGGGVVSAADVARLLGACRKSDNMQVRMVDLEVLTRALGMDGVFSEAGPRTGSALWDPSFVIQRHESMASTGAKSTTENFSKTPQLEDRGGAGPTICHQIGPKDLLQQEPGWMHPGVHNCRVSIACTSWSHRERRVSRNNPPSAAAVLQKRAFESGPSKAAGHERSPSPPAFQVRMPQRESAQQTVVGNNDGWEQIDHQIILGVASGPSVHYDQRHAIRISQREQSAIYLVEDLQGKQTLSIGGTTSSVTFDMELLVEEASKYGLRRCRFAILRNTHVLLEEWFDTSAKVPVRFFITSASFDKLNSYTVSVQWQRPAEQSLRYLREQGGE